MTFSGHSVNTFPSWLNACLAHRLSKVCGYGCNGRQASGFPVHDAARTFSACYSGQDLLPLSLTDFSQQTQPGWTTCAIITSPMSLLLFTSKHHHTTTCQTCHCVKKGEKPHRHSCQLGGLALILNQTAITSFCLQQVMVALVYFPFSV